MVGLARLLPRKCSILCRAATNGNIMFAVVVVLALVKVSVDSCSFDKIELNVSVCVGDATFLPIETLLLTSLFNHFLLTSDAFRLSDVNSLVKH